jgi:hypothetical protein
VQTNRPNLILAYHGTDRAVRDSVLLGSSELIHSKNSYDWLGPGIYFWENSYDRALEWAMHQTKKSIGSRPRIQEPAVLGAVISLGNCLDLLDSKYLEIVRLAHEGFRKSFRKGYPLPKNAGKGPDRLLRHLDCAVIRYLHDATEFSKSPPYDSARAVFFEGQKLYPNAGFRRKNHIQVAVCKRECLRGFFLPPEDRM